MKEFMDNVPLEQLDGTAKFNIHVPGRPNLTFPPDPAHDNRLLELVPLSLAERLQTQYNRNKAHFAIAQDLLQAAQDAYVAKIVRTVVEEVLTERGFIQSAPSAEPVAVVAEAVPQITSVPEVPAALRRGRRPKKVLQPLVR